MLRKVLACRGAKLAVVCLMLLLQSQSEAFSTGVIDSFIKLKIVSLIQAPTHTYSELSYWLRLPIRYESTQIEGANGLSLITINFSSPNQELNSGRRNQIDSFQNKLYIIGAIHLVKDDNSEALYLISTKSWRDVERLLVVLGPNAEDFLKGKKIGPYNLAELRQLVRLAKHSNQKIRGLKIDRYVTIF